MNRRLLPAVILASGALLIFFVTGIFVGWSEATFMLVMMSIIVATAWFPAWLQRILGSVYVALVVWVFARAGLGEGVGILLGLAVGGLTWRFLPVRVHQRVNFMIPSMVLLIFVTAVLMYMAPGNPFASEKASTQQAMQAKAAKFRVMDTAWEYFLEYMKNLLADGSMGLSVTVQGLDVKELLLPALPVSMSLGLLALVFAVAIGLVLGIRAGLKPNSLADYSSMGLAMIGISLPNFVIGAFFLILFVYTFNLLPVAGWGGYEHLLLPALTLALPYAAYIARLARAGTIEVMQQDFVRTARAKGLSERAVILKHALKGAILPVVSFLGPAAAGIFTGSFVVENLFAIPGMGQWFVKGAIGRDYSVVLGTAIIYFSIITIFNLLVDFTYAWLDPRVREEL